ncbi:MAG TPA: hypothetical protein DD473_10040 [Planctomycetaceae bacterium]|nr:hypothetical protein [Planctomycetaceae bacterium]|tara:strand:+ start:1103 stop:2455 length:1353 start_codon:yes stop_codon:yes gene_type:complete
MSRLKQPEEWSILLNAMVEESISNEQEVRFTELLQSEPEFRRQYVLFCQMHTQLNWHLSFKSDSIIKSKEKVVRANPIQQSRASWTIGFVAMSVLTITLVWMGWQSPTDEEPAQIVSASGRVSIIRGQQDKIWILPDDLIRNPVMLQPGDRIQTERVSSAKLRFPDQTELNLRSLSELILPSSSESEVNISRGSLYAKVTPQRTGYPRIFHMSNAQVRVIGTELELLSLPEQSQVAVSEGKVEVIRYFDNSSTAVSAGEFLPVTEKSPMKIVKYPLAKPEWSVDFKNGLPSGWMGRSVEEESAVAAVSESQDRTSAFQISSQKSESGLFTWHDDSVLHLAFLLEPPGWFHISLDVKTYGEVDSHFTYCYANPILWESSTGQWQTISIPLSEFQLQMEKTAPESLGRIPTQIVFRGESESRIFMINHIGVERSGQSKVNESNEILNGKNAR